MRNRGKKTVFSIYFSFVLHRVLVNQIDLLEMDFQIERFTTVNFRKWRRNALPGQEIAGFLKVVSVFQWRV